MSAEPVSLFAAEPAPALRQAPNNMEAEAALLGAILVNNAAYQRVATILEPQHFHHPAHQAIFGGIAALIAEGRLADAVTLRDRLGADEHVKAAGGGTYLARLMASVVSILNAGDYAQTIYDAWVRRQLIQHCEEALATAWEPALDDTATAMVERAQQALSSLEPRFSNRRGIITLGQAAALSVQQNDAALRGAGKRRGIGTGIAALDRRIGGLHPDNLVVIGGRSGMGKSLLAGIIAARAGQAGNPVGIWSGEMSAEAWSQRNMAEVTGISADRQQRDKVDFAEVQQLLTASDGYAALPVYIDDTPQLTLEGLRNLGRRLVQKHKARVLIFDHLTIVKRRHKPEHLRLELGEISGGLKALAKELAVTCVLLCQLNKSLDSRDDRRPALRDLAESGEIEQNADVILLLYREERYLRKEEPRRTAKETDEALDKRRQTWLKRLVECGGKIEIIAAKNRQGQEGSDKFAFDGERSSITDIWGVEGYAEERG